jgi:addiction module HigA family antidote
MTIQEHSPMHPGNFIKRVYLAPFDLGAKDLAERLQVSQSIISRIVNGKSSITPLMALKLSKVLGRSPESWLLMQDQHDLWEAKKTIDLECFQALKFA